MCQNFILLKKSIIYLINLCVCVCVCVCVVVVVLHCIAQILSGCSEWGLLFIAVHRLLIAMASLAVEHRL